MFAEAPGSAPIKSNRWTQTVGNRKFSIDNPQPEQFHLGEAIHALSMQCRYTGHVEDFYSVAEHSIIVADIVRDLGGSRMDQLLGLLHDITEAYVGDLATPVKDEVPHFRSIEDRIWRVFAARYDLPVELPPIVKQADTIALVSEKMVLKGKPPEPWNYGEGVMPDAETVKLLVRRSGMDYTRRIQQSRDMFLDKLKTLANGYGEKVYAKWHAMHEHATKRF